jgi:hypothetical protein
MYDNDVLIGNSFDEEPDAEIKVNSPNGSLKACGADPFERLAYKIGEFNFMV